MIDLDKMTSVLAVDKSKEEIEELRHAIFEKFKGQGMWMFHHFDIVTNRRGLEICDTWGKPLKGEKFEEVKKFAENFKI